MSIKKVAFGFLIAVISSNHVAQAQDVCREILTYASRDESDESRASSTAYSLYKEHCEGSSYKKTSQTDVGLEAVVKAIPIKFNLGTGSNEEKMNAFCKSYSSSGAASSSEAVRTSTVVREALSAFNQCIELANRGVYFTPSILKTQLKVDIRRGSDEVYVLGVRYRPEYLACTVPNSESVSSTATADMNTRKKLSGGTYPISCERKALKEADGTERFPDVDLSVITDRGTLLLPIRGDASMPSKWASDIQDRIGKVEGSLRSDVETLKSAVGSHTTSITSLSTAFQRGGFTCHAPNFTPVGTRVVNGRNVYVRWMATIFDGAMDDGGPSNPGDGMHVYCVLEDATSQTGSVGLCLTGEPCPWR